jgi:phosphatidylserine/phosphatidylglycerophosphate/cardiolipin synthase-like enzyme
MSDINTLITNFFVNVGDVIEPGGSPSDPDLTITPDTLPQTGTGNRTTYLIDGTNYFGALKQEIAALIAGGMDRFFYTNSWHCGLTATPDMVQIGEGTFTSAWKAQATDEARGGLLAMPAFDLKDDSAGPFHPFQDDLVAMANAGVDVRLLVWASPFLVNLEKAANRLFQYWAINVHSLQSVLALRDTALHDRVVLNTLGHTFGAMHLKMVVCGDSTGFRGYATGIDFVDNRNTPPRHEHYPKNFWHDVAIKVEGSGASWLYHYFEQLWNEQVQRSAKTFKAFGSEIKSHVDDTPLVDARETAPITGGQQHTQVLRTLPTMNFSFFETVRAPLSCIQRLVAGFKQEKISFAKDGIFEFRAAQRKAISAAQRYIYIEDQAFENLELGAWINARLKAIPDMKAIFLYMGDPLDDQSPTLFDFMDRVIDGVPTPEERVVFAQAFYTVHAKLTIIDDAWASIGSSNCMRRSFYMDGEISVSVLDEADPSFAANLRKDLWGEHFGLNPGSDRDPLLVLDDALGVWRASWGNGPPGMDLKPGINRKQIPFVFNDPPGNDEFKGPRGTLPESLRDQFDGDSRLEY